MFSIESTQAGILLLFYFIYFILFLFLSFFLFFFFLLIVEVPDGVFFWGGGVNRLIRSLTKTLWENLCRLACPLLLFSGLQICYNWQKDGWILFETNDILRIFLWLFFKSQSLWSSHLNCRYKSALGLRDKTSTFCCHIIVLCEFLKCFNWKKESYATQFVNINIKSIWNTFYNN